MVFSGHYIIEECINNGIDVYMGNYNYKNVFIINGFYKLGKVFMVPYKNGFIVKQRYGIEDYIETFDDLVRIHFNWWVKSKELFKSWDLPDNKWVKYYKKLGLWGNKNEYYRRYSRKLQDIISIVKENATR